MVTFRVKSKNDKVTKAKFAEWVCQLAVIKKQIKALNAEAQKILPRIKEHILDYAEENAGGHFEFREGKHTAILQKRTSVSFKDGAENVLESLGLLKEASSSFIDPDKVARLFEEKKIKEKDLTKILEDVETRALLVT